MNKTIVLLKGELDLAESEYANFEKGSTIIGFDSFPQEIKVWKDEELELAKAYLKWCKCKYSHYPHCVAIQEYALEYYDSNGVCYEFAEAIEKTENIL